MPLSSKNGGCNNNGQCAINCFHRAKTALTKAMLSTPKLKDKTAFLNMKKPNECQIYAKLHLKPIY